MYGVVYFTTTTPIPGLVPFHRSMIDTLGMSHYHARFNLDKLSPEAKITIERDGAFTLGIDPSTIELIALLPSDKRPEVWLNPGFVDPTPTPTTDQPDTTTPPTTPEPKVYYHNAIFAIAIGSPQQETTPTTPFQLQSSPTFSILQTRTEFGGNEYVDIGKLYDSWSNMENKLPQTPVSATEAQQELGTTGGATNAYQPLCDSTLYTNCPQGLDPFGILPPEIISPQPENNGNKISIGLIIGVIVGSLAFVLIALVIAYCAVAWCRENQRACFKPKGKKAAGSQGGKSATSIDMTIQSASNSSVALSTTQQYDFGNSSKTADSGSSPTSVDLEPVNDGEKLPPGWSKQKHSATGQIFYVNTERMISQKSSPMTSIGPDADDLGW